MNDPRFPPVGLLHSQEPVDAPQRMPGAPIMFPPALPNIRPSGYAPSAGDTPAPGGETINDPHHYAQVTDLSTPVLQVSNQLLQQPVSKRNYLMFRNSSATANIFIGFGANASLDSTLKLSPGTIVLYDVVVPQNDIYVIADAAGATLSYSYSNIAG